MFTGTININGTLMDLSIPKVMGIVNLTPDSFFEGSRTPQEEEVEKRVRQLLAEGVDILDVGAYSTRPGAADVPVDEEIRRLRKGLAALRRVAPNAVISVDTFRADVAKMCIEEYGVAMVNDISGGDADPHMIDAVAYARVPYIIVHMQGTPQTMQQAPHYDKVVKEVMVQLAEKVRRLHEREVNDVILDPGFGFGKTLEQNYEVMMQLERLSVIGLPVLAGVSRKSMIYKALACEPGEALNGTTVLNTIALQKGASILRVHDVREAVECVALVERLKLSE